MNATSLAVNQQLWPTAATTVSEEEQRQGAEKAYQKGLVAPLHHPQSPLMKGVMIGSPERKGSAMVAPSEKSFLSEFQAANIQRESATVATVATTTVGGDEGVMADVETTIRRSLQRWKSNEWSSNSSTDRSKTESNKSDTATLARKVVGANCNSFGRSSSFGASEESECPLSRTENSTRATPSLLPPVYSSPQRRALRRCQSYDGYSEGGETKRPHGQSVRRRGTTTLSSPATPTSETTSLPQRHTHACELKAETATLDASKEHNLQFVSLEKKAVSPATIGDSKVEIDSETSKELPSSPKCSSEAKRQSLDSGATGSTGTEDLSGSAFVVVGTTAPAATTKTSSPTKPPLLRPMSVRGGGMNVLRSSMGSSFRRQYSSVSCDGVAVVTAAVEEGDPASFDKVDPDRTSPTTTTTTAATTLSSTSSHSGAKAILHGETNRRVPIARRNSMSCTGVGLFRRQSSQASIQEYKTNYSEEFTKDSGEEGCHVSPDRRQRMTRRSSARGGLFRRQSSQASIQYNHSVDDVAHDSATPPTPPQQLIDQRPRLSRRSSSRLFRRQSSQASIQYQPSEELAMGYEPAHPTSTNQASSTDRQRASRRNSCNGPLFRRQGSSEQLVPPRDSTSEEFVLPVRTSMPPNAESVNGSSDRQRAGRRNSCNGPLFRRQASSEQLLPHRDLPSVEYTSRMLSNPDRVNGSSGGPLQQQSPKFGGREWKVRKEGFRRNSMACCIPQNYDHADGMAYGSTAAAASARGMSRRGSLPNMYATAAAALVAPTPLRRSVSTDSSQSIYPTKLSAPNSGGNNPRDRFRRSNSMMQLNTTGSNSPDANIMTKVQERRSILSRLGSLSNIHAGSNDDPTEMENDDADGDGALVETSVAILKDNGTCERLGAKSSRFAFRRSQSEVFSSTKDAGVVGVGGVDESGEAQTSDDVKKRPHFSRMSSLKSMNRSKSFDDYRAPATKSSDTKPLRHSTHSSNPRFAFRRSQSDLYVKLAHSDDRKPSPLKEPRRKAAPPLKTSVAAATNGRNTAPRDRAHTSPSRPRVQRTRTTETAERRRAAAPPPPASRGVGRSHTAIPLYIVVPAFVVTAAAEAASLSPETESPQNCTTEPDPCPETPEQQTKRAASDSHRAEPWEFLIDADESHHGKEKSSSNDSSFHLDQSRNSSTGRTTEQHPTSALSECSTILQMCSTGMNETDLEHSKANAQPLPLSRSVSEDLNNTPDNDDHAVRCSDAAVSGIAASVDSSRRFEVQSLFFNDDDDDEGDETILDNTRVVEDEDDDDNEDEEDGSSRSNSSTLEEDGDVSVGDEDEELCKVAAFTDSALDEEDCNAAVAEDGHDSGDCNVVVTEDGNDDVDCNVDANAKGDVKANGVHDHGNEESNELPPPCSDDKDGSNSVDDLTFADSTNSSDQHDVDDAVFWASSALNDPQAVLAAMEDATPAAAAAAATAALASTPTGEGERENDDSSSTDDDGHDPSGNPLRVSAGSFHATHHAQKGTIDKPSLQDPAIDDTECTEDLYIETVTEATSSMTPLSASSSSSNCNINTALLIKSRATARMATLLGVVGAVACTLAPPHSPSENNDNDANLLLESSNDASQPETATTASTSTDTATNNMAAKRPSHSRRRHRHRRPLPHNHQPHYIEL